jgi:hypothetical protein
VLVLNSGSGICFTIDVTVVCVIVTLLSRLLLQELIVGMAYFLQFHAVRFSFLLEEKYMKLPPRALPAACGNLVTVPCVASLSSFVIKSC